MPTELSGGNSNVVVRDGSVVQRRASAATPTLHRLLQHLQTQGIDWIPTVVDIDRTSERLSYLPGFVPQYPMPPWIWDDTVLRDLGDRLRELHDATQTFDRTNAVWGQEPHEPREVICHNDIAPYNVVFDRERRLSGLIDFDEAAPGPRLWDLAHAAYRFVPLHEPGSDEAPATSGDEQLRRVQVLLRAYGHDAAVPEVLRWCRRRVEDLANHARKRHAHTEDRRFLAHVERYVADAAYIQDLAR